ncbi:hypothetical protein U9M48_037578 [Paspalum notatum var. saurae]|uniref:Uncharacterized protein n=1 Tax=Paspalum notatum var. saurae TaxID=547442 RepID=A0AAQ3UF70_PASNO
MAYFRASRSTALAMFDFATEQWRPTPLQGPPPIVDPSGGGGSASFCRLSSLGGRLVAVQSTGDDDMESKVDLWFLEDDGGGSSGTDGRGGARGTRCGSHRIWRVMDSFSRFWIVAYWLPGREGLGMLNLETGTWTTMATVDTCYYSCVNRHPQVLRTYAGWTRW